MAGNKKEANERVPSIGGDDGVSRRDFLYFFTVIGGALAVSSCAPLIGEQNQPPTSEPPPPTQPPSELEPSLQPEKFSPEITPSAPEGVPFSPAVNPPEYQAAGGEIIGLTQEELKEQALSQWYRLYKKEMGIEGQPYYFAGPTEFEVAMDELATSHPEIALHQVQSADKSSVLTYMVEDKEGVKSVFWGFTSDGAVAYAEPNLVNSDGQTRLDKIGIPSGLRPEFMYNPEDKHWYMFGVDEQGEAEMWFNTDGATKDNFATQWAKVEKDNSEAILAQLQLMLPEGISVNSIEDLGDGAFRAANEYGTTLFIKPNKDSEWLLAPAGFHKIYGAWQEWNPQTKQFKNNYDPDLSPVAELCNFYLRNDIKPDTVGIAGDVLGFNMQVKPEMAEKAYEDRIKVLAENSNLRKFWNSLGVAPNKEALLKWLKSDKSIGGPENKPGWVPVGPDAPSFSLLIGSKNGGYHADIGELDLIRNRGGFYLDAVEVGLQSWTEVNNPWMAAWITSIKMANVIEGTKNHSLINDYGSGTRFFGYQLDPYSNRLIFLCGETDYSTAIMGGDIVYLGGEKPGSYRDPGSAIVAMEYLSLYEVALDQPGSFYQKQLFTHSPTGTGSASNYQLEIEITTDNTIFETKD